ncbi:MAG: hypothetical protein LBI35_06420 [Burkholderiales bacterium]|nr:hypothetical protein [Burkholderiales bacterium]
MLALIEARLEGRLLKEHSEYSIAGRSMKLMSIPDLLAARSKYLVEVKREEAAAGGRSRVRVHAVL